jgi:thioredoxin-related protein
MFGVNYRILMGTAEAAEKFGRLEGYPTTLIFDREGKLVQRHVGYRPREVFEREIQALLLK